MAQQTVTTDGTFTVPGAYPKVEVQNAPSGLSTTGVIVAIGEAEAGPAFSEETDSIDQNAFGPDDIAAILAKYKSGPIVDAFRGAVAASGDPQIQGSIFRYIPLKTNVGVKAASTLPKIGGGTYATLSAALGGKAGNLLARKVTAQTAEVVPTTGSLVYAPAQVSTVAAFRVDGGSEVTATLGVGVLPSAAVSAIAALTGVLATGGTARSVITAVAGDLTLTQDTGRQCHVVITTAWANAPTVGDTVYIPTGSPFAAANEGSYVVTAATTTRIDMYKLLDAAGDGDDVTNPATATVTIAATTDLQGFAPIVISNEAGAVLPGQGKTLEIAQSGSNDVSNNLFVFDGADVSPPASAYDSVSTTSAPITLYSGAEYQVDLNISRASDALNEDVGTSLGQVVLTLGYKGTTGSAVIASNVLTITVTGGSGTSPAAISLADYTTVNDLVTYLNTLTGFSAAAGTTAQGQRLSVDLDAGTYGIGSTWGARTGRIKADGARFMAAVNASSSVRVAAVSPATKLVGLPDTATLAFLTGGSRGATTNALVSAALDALQAVRCNFVVPLFSRDASGGDIADGLTASTSTYSIDSINAALKTHVLLMSQVKRRRPRQGFASKRTTFALAQDASGNLATERVAMTFQDVKDLDSTGTLIQFQPWMAAVKAAGMQAAGFYRAIVGKFVNISGVLQAAGDFNDQLDSNLEDALLAGLLPLTRDEAGGFRWVSDQTTYTKDSNFVRNSVQAVYAADTIAQTTAQRMERAFVGQSVAEISAPLALTALEGIMEDMRKLKLIASSIDAPKGFKNATIRITGGDLVVRIEIKLAGAIYFVPINFLVTPVQQSAG